ncbi:Yip1 family protein [Mangrovicoccus sp. HB161399]|uniref:Yip1 family protein n=1 Tax=Mangrovicoccus sp. HB161399 TaxID=2720392 RepID=UPI001552392E|nr:Yip1 family protein [Mangrovicoccus sp. HB161399]
MTPRLDDFTPGGIIALVLATLRDPRGTARQILAMQLPQNVLWLILFTVAIVSALIGQAAGLLFLPSPGAGGDAVVLGPLFMAGLQLGGLVLTVFAVHHIGRIMGGQGTLERSLLLLSWLEIVMVAVQLAQLVLLFLLSFTGSSLPGLLVMAASFALVAWVFTAFVAEIHGFSNLWLVFLMIIASVLAISFALSLILSFMGLTFSGGAGV